MSIDYSATMVAKRHEVQKWVLLSYHVPREPSTPRIAIWRKLKQLGVAQLGDGLVALPQTARTLEHFEWIAQQVLEADGRAVVWTAQPTLNQDANDLMDQLRTARSDEYQTLLAEVEAVTAPPDNRTIEKWRRAWRAIDKRDHFDADGRETSRLAIADAAAIAAATVTS